jgi:hypothetical protein
MNQNDLIYESNQLYTVAKKPHSTKNPRFFMTRPPLRRSIKARQIGDPQLVFRDRHHCCAWATLLAADRSGYPKRGIARFFARVVSYN